MSYYLNKSIKGSSIISNLNVENSMTINTDITTEIGSSYDVGSAVKPFRNGYFDNLFVDGFSIENYTKSLFSSEAPVSYVDGVIGMIYNVSQFVIGNEGLNLNTNYIKSLFSSETPITITDGEIGLNINTSLEVIDNQLSVKNSYIKNLTTSSHPITNTDGVIGLNLNTSQFNTVDNKLNLKYDAPITFESGKLDLKLKTTLDTNGFTLNKIYVDENGALDLNLSSLIQAGNGISKLSYLDAAVDFGLSYIPGVGGIIPEIEYIAARIDTTVMDFKGGEISIKNLGHSRIPFYDAFSLTSDPTFLYSSSANEISVDRIVLNLDVNESTGNDRVVPKNYIDNLNKIAEDSCLFFTQNNLVREWDIKLNDKYLAVDDTGSLVTKITGADNKSISVTPDNEIVISYNTTQFSESNDGKLQCSLVTKTGSCLVLDPDFNLDIDINLDELEVDIDGKLSIATAVKDSIEDLKTDMDTAKTDIDTLQADVDVAKTDIDTLQADVDVAETKITSSETKITAVEARATALETRATASEGFITTLQTQTTANTAAITANTVGTTANTASITATNIGLTATNLAVTALSLTSIAHGADLAGLHTFIDNEILPSIETLETTISSTSGTGSFVLNTNPSISSSLNLTGSTSGVISIKSQATAGTYNLNLPTTAGTAGQVLTSQGGTTSAMTWTNQNPGTVTSVGLTAPAFLSVSGSPVTSTGTIDISFSGTALPVLNGGTGTTTSTGSGSNVLSSSPVLITPIIGVAGGTSLNLTENINSGSQSISGLEDGVISIKSQASAGTYNFNLPITAGTAGQVLTSQGGTTSAMTWTNPNSSLLSPGPIGSTTPSTGIFTTLEATENISLTNGTSNLISYNSNGLAIPINGINGSVGQKINLFPGSVNSTPYGFGISSGALFSVVPSGNKHEFYHGTLSSMTIERSTLRFGNASFGGGNLLFSLQHSSTSYLDIAMIGTNGNYSSSAVIADTVIRNIGGKLILQSGSGAGAIVINADNSLNILSSTTLTNLTVNSTADINFFRPTLATTNSSVILFGRDNTNFNTSMLKFNYNVLNSNTNTLGFGFWGAENLITLDGSGTARFSGRIQFQNSIANRKIVLFEIANNDHQFYGIGINGGVLRFQTPSTADDHIFYAGTSTTSSNEIFRIKGDGSGIKSGNSIIENTSPSLTVRTNTNTSGAVYLGNNAHGIKREGPNDVRVYTSSGSVVLQTDNVDRLVCSSSVCTVNTIFRSTVNWSTFLMNAATAWPNSANTACANFYLAASSGETLASDGTSFANHSGRTLFITVSWTARRDSNGFGDSQFWISKGGLIWARSDVSGTANVSITANLNLLNDEFFQLVGFQNSGSGNNFSSSGIVSLIIHH